jgi:hypothetical protein
MNPELEEFRRQIEQLRTSAVVAAVTVGDRVELSRLTLDEVESLLASEAGYSLLASAAGLNRTSLKKALADPEAAVVHPRLRRAYVVKTRLPVSSSFESLANGAVALRRSDLQRKARGQIEQVFRDRLAAEHVPLLMSPPVRTVPGIVIAGRKPDGVWPDPASGMPPKVYLEIKNIRRVSDDIQKRLYELAEAALEMKLLYSGVRLKGLAIQATGAVRDPGTASALRTQTLGHPPVVVGLLICSRIEAERYRTGAEAFIDRIFFQEEIDECIAFISDTIQGFIDSSP